MRNAATYPSPALGWVYEVELGVEGGLLGGGRSLMLPVIARICVRAHSRSIRCRIGGLPAVASLTAFALAIAAVAILSASSLPGHPMCERTCRICTTPRPLARYRAV